MIDNNNIEKGFEIDYPKDGDEFVGNMFDIYAKGAKFGYSEATKWVDVKTPPKESGQVLGIMKDTLDIYVCFFKKSRNLYLVYGAGADPISDMKVTHWMSLPQPPKD